MSDAVRTPCTRSFEVAGVMIRGGFLIRRISAIRRFFAGFLRCDSRTIMKSFLKKNRSRIHRKFA